MKRERSIVENRRASLMDAIKHNPDLNIVQLAEMFTVSQITVRRDLQYLNDQSMIRRFHGGYQVLEPARNKDSDIQHICTAAIAAYAATLIEENDIVFINTSSTALKILSYIDRDNVTVITNNGNAIRTEFPHSVNVYLTGGELRYPKAALVGDFAIRNLQSIRANKSFLGCSGLSLENGMTTQNANEVNINQLMIENIRKKTYILADHSKIGVSSSFTSCAIEKITDIITDDMVPQEIIASFQAQGITVHQVPIKT